MNIEQIKSAVDSGQTVRWANSGYTVIRDRIGQYLIVCDNGSCVGLTDIHGERLNGRPDQFYVEV